MLWRIMEIILKAINESWWWLGPWQLICWGTALIALVVEIFYGAIEEMRG